jgi:uncharacterized protein (DUF305 family)
MNKKLITVLALAALLVIGVGVYTLTKEDTPDTSTTTNSSQQASTSTEESATYKQFAALKGEDYDRMFLSNMIAHHQGAVDMAKLAQTNAKHEELKSMANDIISAQTSEITSMENYQKAWGYPASSGEMMEDHSAMGMMDDMAGMMTELQGKTGDDFDKTFVQLMIEHHTSAIDMAKPGVTNAQHQEVKDLAAAVVSAQTKEVAQMKQWQKDWGYES